MHFFVPLLVKQLAALKLFKEKHLGSEPKRLKLCDMNRNPYSQLQNYWHPQKRTENTRINDKWNERFESGFFKNYWHPRNTSELLTF